jgi:hypothetical protein
MSHQTATNHSVMRKRKKKKNPTEASACVMAAAPRPSVGFRVDPELT